MVRVTVWMERELRDAIDATRRPLGRSQSWLVRMQMIEALRMRLPAHIVDQLSQVRGLDDFGDDNA